MAPPSRGGSIGGDCDGSGADRHVPGEPAAFYDPRVFLIEPMSPKKRRRLYFAIALVFAGATGAALVVRALQDNVLYFYSPSDIAVKHVPQDVSFRIGGLVAKGSVVRGPGADVRFVVTDGKTKVPVQYSGSLPDLFREGQGVVATGALHAGVFRASEVLAKHDERYMPPEVVDALKRAGRWKEGGT